MEGSNTFNAGWWDYGGFRWASLTGTVSEAEFWEYLRRFPQYNSAIQPSMAVPEASIAKLAMKVPPNELPELAAYAMKLGRDEKIKLEIEARFSIPWSYLPIDSPNPVLSTNVAVVFDEHQRAKILEFIRLKELDERKQKRTTPWKSLRRSQPLSKPSRTLSDGTTAEASGSLSVGLHTEDTQDHQEESYVANAPRVDDAETLSSLMGAQQSLEASEVPTDVLEKQFMALSGTAYKKLLAAAPSQSRAFQKFACSLATKGGHTGLVKRGISSLERFLAHDTISSLVDVYSFLHIASAIAQITTNDPVEATPAQFRCGIGTLRGCLDADRLIYEEFTERDLFDEIVKVMWEEIDYAITWIGERVDWEFMSEISSKARRLQLASDLLRWGAANDTEPPWYLLDNNSLILEVDPSFVPSFKRELWHLREGNGPDPAFEGAETSDRNRDDRINEDLSCRRSAPPGLISKDRVGWLDIVTGSAFMIIIGFLQILGQTKQEFQYLPSKQPYSFLCDPGPISTEAGRHENFVDAVRQHIVSNATEPKYKWIINIAFALVKYGVLQTVRHFEGYVLRVWSSIRKTKAENEAFAWRLLWNCYSCSDQLKPDMPDRVKPCSELDYSLDYICRTTELAERAHFDKYGVSEGLTLAPMEMDVEIRTEEPCPDGNQARPEDGLHRSSHVVTAAPAPTVASARSPGQLPACHQPGCNNRTFSTAGNLDRHNRVYHPVKGRPLAVVHKCDVAGCRQTFNRRDNLQKHQRRVHLREQRTAHFKEPITVSKAATGVQFKVWKPVFK